MMFLSAPATNTLIKLMLIHPHFQGDDIPDLMATSRRVSHFNRTTTAATLMREVLFDTIDFVLRQQCPLMLWMSGLATWFPGAFL